MAAVLWLADWVQVLVRREQPVQQAAVELVGILAVVSLACWQSSYFTVGSEVSIDGYGHYRINLLAIVDSNGWSYVLLRVLW